MRCSGVGCWRCASAFEAGTNAMAALAARAVIGRKILTETSPRLYLDATVTRGALPSDESIGLERLVAGPARSLEPPEQAHASDPVLSG